MERESFAELAGTVYDAGDESVATMIEELSHTHMERYARELRQIQKARKRLADGEINECVDCGDDIGYQRLRAYPDRHALHLLPDPVRADVRPPRPRPGIARRTTYWGWIPASARSAVARNIVRELRRQLPARARR